MPFNRYGLGQQFNKEQPDFSYNDFNVMSANGNTIVFIKPTPQRTISKQALRGNVYTFSDQFMHQYKDIVDRSIRSGTSKGLQNLLTSEEGRNAVSLNPNTEAVVDLNALNYYWKFILIIKKFPNVRTLASGVSYTCIITGRCDQEEAPVIENAGRYILNDRCDLVIETKSLFQSHEANFRANKGLRHQTQSSTGYAHNVEVKSSTDTDLYENTPGGMNFSVDLSPSGEGVSIISEPVGLVGQYGPTAIERKQQAPGIALRNTMVAIRKTFNAKDTNALSSVQNFESSIPSMSLNDPTLSYPELINNLKTIEHQHTSWSQDQFGPNVNEHLSPKDLETTWGVENVKILRGDNAIFFQGSDQTDTSTTTLWESMLEKIIPTYMIELQIDSVSFQLAMEKDPTTGILEPQVRLEGILPVIPTITQPELHQRWNSLLHLLTPTLEQIYATAGTFLLSGRINITTTSTLSLNLLEFGDPDNHVREFFPSEFALTTPLIGSVGTVSANQASISNFLANVCAEQTPAGYDNRWRREDNTFMASNPPSFMQKDYQSNYDQYSEPQAQHTPWGSLSNI